ncbi:DEAD/DEAH box helicase [Aspergillus melleus]|uniref:DEAD/DEAH box helicase n=1 Tax=Aspergillus melleus TaxID=138277 RepID=UPI001E8C9DEA|nr:uncharacterized protein LDX57_011362 [Aspergillus melleus]KAH8433728.1 hypothetical protein LDX57_011362 [Aspergillus melleus]
MTPVSYPKTEKGSASRKREKADADPTAASGKGSQPLFTKMSSTVKFPVKSIKYHGLEEDISVAREISMEPAVTLFLSSAFLKLRQGVSTDEGRSRSSWNITFHIHNITVVSLGVKKDELIYTFNSAFDLKGDADTEKQEDLPMPSSYPLATTHLKNQVVVITLGLPNPKLWERQSEIVCQVLRAGRLTISEALQAYITTNREAINKEAEEEHETLAICGCQVKGVAVGERILLGIWPKEERPFRLYRGCNLVLRGEQFFQKEDAKGNRIRGQKDVSEDLMAEVTEDSPKGYRIRGQKDVSEDWMAEVTEDSPKWTALIDAPVHAVLLNQVSVTLVDKVKEDNVKVHPVSNPIVQMTMLTATKKLSEHWGDESFDAICREFEDHEAKLPDDHKNTLTLSSMFLPSAPRVNTHNPLDASLDLTKLVPQNWKLTEAQTKAATQLLTHTFSLVVGPPGTGKTQTVAAATMLITQILHLRGSVGKARLAVLLPTHAAAHAVLQQLSAAFTRYEYGAKKVIRLRSRADSHSRLFANTTHPYDDIERMIALARESPREYSQFLKGIDSLRASGWVKNEKEFNRERSRLMQSVMEEAQVVVTLPLNLKAMLQRKFNPQFVIFDEASFFRDPELFSILGQLRADVRVLFTGDPKQLSPPVFTDEGRTAWGISAFERMCDKKYTHTLLDISFRSHKVIYQPTSVAYYEGKVKPFHDKPPRNARLNQASPLVVQIGNHTWTIPGVSHFLHLEHTQGDTEKDPSGSLRHPREAELGVTLAKRLQESGARDILIISPYRAQVAQIKKIWDQKYPQSPIRPRVQTVDASPGSEADGVIVLITRNTGGPGFLQSTKRTNVMLSRARMAQYIVGNWNWVGGKSFTKDAGKCYAYLEEAERVLREEINIEYVVCPLVEEGTLGRDRSG